MNRIPHGRPAFVHKNHSVVAADAIALVSGVNFGSVEKVLIAIAVIKEFSGTDLDQLLSVTDIPLRRVDLERAADESRIAATRVVAEAVADSPVYHGHEELLHLRGRMLSSLRA